MKMKKILFTALLASAAAGASAQMDAPGFNVFQFPADQIPRIDGSFEDWELVPASYIVGTDEIWDDSRKHEGVDRSTLDIKVRVGWVAGLNRLYFLYEAYDDYWDFTQTGLHNDTFEIVVDGDYSGGPLIDERHPQRELFDRWEAYFLYHGVHAQNYHIFTPPGGGKDWTLAWGSQPWIKELPWANAAYDYDFAPGEAGTLRLEFYITPFDYAGNDPSRAVESQLYENKKIGLAWAIIDYDDAGAPGNNGFWNLSQHHGMFGDASLLRTFTLMPLEPEYRPVFEADWSWTIVDMSRRAVAFVDRSVGAVGWKWDFGDGTTSAERHPVHTYAEAGRYIVTLEITGADGRTDLATRVWDVAVK